MIKKIISYVLVFLLIILLTLSTLIIILNFVFFNENNMTEVMRKQDYYSKTYYTIMESFKDNTIQSGLDESVLDGIISIEQVENDTESIIKGIYGTENITIDTNIIKTRLNEKIENIIQENNKNVTPDEQEAINIYMDTIENIYKDGILYFPNYLNEIQRVVSKANSLVSKFAIVVHISTIILFMAIIVINKKESLKYISISALSTGILLIIPKIMETVHLNTHNIVLFNQNFSTFVIDIMESIFNGSLICGIIYCILSIVVHIVNIKINEKE